MTKMRKRKKPTTYGKGVAYNWLVQHKDFAGDDCLPWPFSRDSRVGRGLLGHEGKRYWAHRLMCILVHGEPPSPKHQASHSCGRGHEGCVNPRHLEWKTNSENQYDRRKHGTQMGGIGTRTRLTPEQIAEMRALKGKMVRLEIAKKFGVKIGCVEYWHKHDRQPLPPGKSPSAVLRRQMKMSVKNDHQ
jgi:hypothetical protein